MYSQLMGSLKDEKFTISGEIDPPKGADKSVIIEQARYLKGHVVAANVTDNPLGIVIMNTLVPCHLMQSEVGIEAVYQVTCRDRNRIALQSDILGASALEFKNVLALTGDHPRKGDHPQAKAVFDLDSVQLTKLLRRMIDDGKDMAGNELNVAPRMHVGVGISPGIRPFEPELIKFEKKIGAGAEFAQTQVVYDPEVLGELMDTTKHLGIPILVGIAPLKSIGMAKFMAKNVPGVVVPEEIMKRLEKAKDLKETAIDITAELLREIKEAGFLGAHIMPVGMDYAVGEIISRSGVKGK
ncbi:MAG: methylenetetrahydrofolate reductase [Candidatus Hydrothermarchaeota archaeon]|jgi:5,10-methylenetetrahydrofolate reductase|nr:methylenetetrahydrofolate reductase [Candidatus Hydrothermarchaeota archaeon]